MVNGEPSVSSASPVQRPPSLRLNAIPQSRSSPAHHPPLPGWFLPNSDFLMDIGSTFSPKLRQQMYGDGLLLLGEVSGEREPVFKENHYCEAWKELWSVSTGWLCTPEACLGSDPRSKSMGILSVVPPGTVATDSHPRRQSRGFPGAFPYYNV